MKQIRLTQDLSLLYGNSIMRKGKTLRVISENDDAWHVRINGVELTVLKSEAVEVKQESVVVLDGQTAFA